MDGAPWRQIALLASVAVAAVPSFSNGQAPPRNATATDWVRIPAQEFEMGCVPADRECSDNENPRHRVRISRDFWIMTTEVTASAFHAYARATARSLPTQPEWSRENHPVVDVTWDEAAAYCGWIGGRLPTEAEWEVAARGGRDGSIFPWGDVYEKGRANDSDDFRSPHTVPVGSFPPNGVGLHDVSGNVWEWVSDWYAADYYQHSPGLDPKGPVAGDGRTARGGGWRPFPRLMRLSNRGHYPPETHNYYVGFRCVRDGAPPEGGAPPLVTVFRSRTQTARPTRTGGRSAGADPESSSR